MPSGPTEPLNDAEQWKLEKELRAARDRWGGYAGMAVLAVDYLQAMRIRPKLQRSLDAIYFARFRGTTEIRRCVNSDPCTHLSERI